MLNNNVIIQAPMAGGICCPELVAAVSNHQGIGSYATGYMTYEKIKQDIQFIKKLTNKPFAVNLFIHLQPQYDANLAKNYQFFLNTYRQQLKLPCLDDLPEILIPPDINTQIIELVIQEQVPILSFTFGLLSKHQISKLKKNNIFIIGTATSLKEAYALAKIEVDAIVAQGYEAGGHRGSFLQDSRKQTLELTKQLSSKLTLPIIAAGGMMNGAGIIEALRHGAKAVQMGTAFLATKESAAHIFYKNCLLEKPQLTRISNTLTGKEARGLHTQLMDDLAYHFKSIPSYPIPHVLSSAIRKEALVQHQKQLCSMWCGEGVGLIRGNLSVHDLMSQLHQEIIGNKNNR